MPPHQKADAPANDQRFPDGFASSLQAIGRGNVLLARCCLELQMRTVNLVSAEIAGYWREMAKHLNWTEPLDSLPERYAGPFGDPHNAREMQEIGRQWIELASIAQSAFVHAFIRSFAPAAADAAGADPLPNRRFAPERRASALVIPFPDRRVTKG